MNRSSKSRLLPLIALAGWLSGCVSVDFDYPRQQSFAFRDTADTYLASKVEDNIAAHPAHQSGFSVLNNGIDALAARLLLAERAERSIDLQYYLIKNDIVGYAFIDALLKAADRGVRVRVLLDDVFTRGYDAGMVGLDSHPNVEIRIFNPFARAAGRSIGAVTNFRRINRRMHNKSFTVDNQVTVMGGRNIADEYFGAREDAKFGDLDVMAIGSVVDEVSNMFDAYWNHKKALPLPAFANMPDDPAAEMKRVRADVEASRVRIANSAYAAAVADKYLELVESDAEKFTWADFELVFDSPDKAVRSKAADASSIRTSLVTSLQSAEQEIMIATPYFVPRRTGVEFLSELTRKGVEVIVVTNSLAANNQFIVHGGYAPSRKPLLRNGVKLYEVRADAEVAGAEIVAASGAKATLHTKAFIVDRREIFIGSFNFDPRSAYINTEMGVIIKSEDIARTRAQAVDESLAAIAYEVLLNDQGRLRWRDEENGQEVMLKKEPQTTWGQRVMANLTRLLPIRGQL